MMALEYTMKRHYFITFCMILSVNAMSAIRFDFFPERSAFFSASVLELRHYLYTGSEKGRAVNHGNLGLEFPLVSFYPDNACNYLAGVAAAAHLVMYPKNLKFSVDNIYATLAVYVDAKVSPVFSLRLYPVYHVSGHLVDGAAGDSALMNARAVSSEMVKLEGAFAPVDHVSISGGYGYYYHVCAQKGLTDLFDLNLQWQPIPEKWFSPYLTLSGQFIHLLRWRAGFDLEAGARFMGKRGRGIGIGFRLFNRMDPGYYFDRREKSEGVQIDFIL